MDHILHVFWKFNQDLLPEYVKTLSVFYKRIQSFDSDITPLYIFNDFNSTAQIISQNHPQVTWLVVHPVGSYFLDQAALVHQYKKLISEFKPDIQFASFYNNDVPLVGKKSFILHLPTYLKMSESIVGSKETKDILKLICKKFDAQSKHREKLPESFQLTACYPDIDDQTDFFNKSLEDFYNFRVPNNYQQRQLLAFYFLKKLNLDRDSILPSPFSYAPRKSHVFFFNTEALIPDPEWVQNNKQPLDTYVGACAGFLDICNLHSFGYHNKTEIFYYDLNPDSIRYKKYLWENFDGDWDHLADVIHDFCLLNPDVEGFDPEIYPDKTDDIKLIFNNDTILFRKTWNDLKKLKKNYVATDLIFDFKRIFSQLPKKNKIFFSISDVFLAHNEILWGISKIKKQYGAFLETATSFDNLILQGKDPNDQLFIEFGYNLRQRRSFLHRPLNFFR